MKKALDFFHEEGRPYNCAQSVALSRGRAAADFASFGGGRAPEGLCGALYAAMQCVPEEKREALRKEFIARNGSDLCHTLKMTCKIPCDQCVSVGGELAEKYGAE